MGTRLSGLHIEVTGDKNVTECNLGMEDNCEKVESSFKSYCDPRLNYYEAIMDMMHQFSDLYKTIV